MFKVMFLYNYYRYCIAHKTSHSVYWADGLGHFYKRSDYKDLLPSRPRVVNPANPSNNVWVTGVKGYRPGESPSDYDPGDGNTALLKRYIHTIDLSRPI